MINFTHSSVKGLFNIRGSHEKRVKKPMTIYCLSIVKFIVQSKSIALNHCNGYLEFNPWGFEKIRLQIENREYF